VGQFLAADTWAHRLLWFGDISTPAITSVDTVAGIPLLSPHDVLCDSGGQLQYALNPHQPIVFRMREPGVNEAARNFSAVAGYSRALTLVDGTLYLVASSKGRVIEIRDFDAGAYTVYQSYGKIAEDVAGSWETTGFVLNDVEYYDGWWYATNFFSDRYANGTDHNRFKFVRFRCWRDFEDGFWQELSHLLPDNGVPYFMTVHDGSLYLPLFGELGFEDAILRVTTGLFLDGFESGILTMWSSTVP
jgi:hypothetical protein